SASCETTVIRIAMAIKNRRWSAVHFRARSSRLGLRILARLRRNPRTGDRRDDSIHVHMAVLDEQAELVLRAGHRCAGDIDTGDVCLHRWLVENRRLRFVP